MCLRTGTYIYIHVYESRHMQTYLQTPRFHRGEEAHICCESCAWTCFADDTFRCFCNFFHRFACRCYMMFGAIFVKFSCHFMSFGRHFGVILVSFWCPWVSLGDPGAPRRPKMLPESILPPFWGAFGTPWGTLRGDFSLPLAALGAQEPKKTTHWRTSVHRPDF